MAAKNTGIQKQDKQENNVTQETHNQQTTATRQAQAPFFTPLVDIIENQDEFIFQSDLPGVKAEDLDVSFENGVLSIEGHVRPREQDQRQFLAREYETGTFYRQFTLRTPVDVENIRAELRNGVLELHVPKDEKVRTRKIEVKSA